MEYTNQSTSSTMSKNIYAIKNITTRIHRFSLSLKILIIATTVSKYTNSVINRIASYILRLYAIKNKSLIRFDTLV